jgi:hypothetical protein
MLQRIGVALTLWALASPALWADCVVTGDTAAARGAAKNVCAAFPKAASVEIVGDSAWGTRINITLPGPDFTAVLATEATVKSFAKNVVTKASVPAASNFRLTAHAADSKEPHLLVGRVSGKVVASWNDAVYDWPSLD